jgi:hypothetical protein
VFQRQRTDGVTDRAIASNYTSLLIAEEVGNCSKCEAPWGLMNVMTYQKPTCRALPSRAAPPTSIPNEHRRKPRPNAMSRGGASGSPGAGGSDSGSR